MSLLILVRHGESDGNVQQVLTGQHDAALTVKGKRQARQVATQLKNIPIHRAYTSKLRRAKETLAEIQDQLEGNNIPTTTDEALNERNFGSLTNRSKDAILKDLGEHEYFQVVKGWDNPAPGGESLRMVYERAVPYFQSNILNDVINNKNTLVVSHHQTLRALMMFLESIPDSKIADVKIQNAEAIIYDLKENDTLVRRLVRESTF